jgi:hypothetical protein
METKDEEIMEATAVTSERSKASEAEHAELFASGWARVRQIGVRIAQAALIILALFVVSRIPVVLEREETAKVVAKIHATKLTMDDVMGTNLPPSPGVEAGMTIVGIDANKNGIRDDVELAIFKEYATSSKTRAVLLQYALALQMEFTQPLANTETVIAVAQEEGRAYSCVGQVLSRDDLSVFAREGRILREWVEQIQLNTTERKRAQQEFYDDHLQNYGALNQPPCDIDLSTLPD